MGGGSVDATNFRRLWQVTFADEVVAIIAGQLPKFGVAAMSGGIAGGIVEKLGERIWQRRKVEVGERNRY